MARNPYLCRVGRVRNRTENKAGGKLDLRRTQSSMDIEYVRLQTREYQSIKIYSNFFLLDIFGL